MTGTEQAVVAIFLGILTLIWSELRSISGLGSESRNLRQSIIDSKFSVQELAVEMRSLFVVQKQLLEIQRAKNGMGERMDKADGLKPKAERKGYDNAYRRLLAQMGVSAAPSELAMADGSKFGSSPPFRHETDVSIDAYGHWFGPLWIEIRDAAGDNPEVHLKFDESNYGSRVWTLSDVDALSNFIKALQQGAAEMFRAIKEKND